MEKIKLGVVGLGYPAFDHQLGTRFYREIIELVESQELIESRIIEEPVLEGDCTKIAAHLREEQIDALLVVNLTFSYGGHIIKLVEGLTGVPVIQWALPEPPVADSNGGNIKLNSVCGANLNTSFLKRLGIRYRIIFGSPDDSGARQQLLTIIKALGLRKELRGLKLCLIGSRVPGFYLSHTDELLLRKKVGPELTQMSLLTLIRGAERQREKRVEDEIRKMYGEVDEVTATREMLEKTARIQLFLQDYIEENKIDGLSIKCWPELQSEYNFSICGVVSRLNAGGIVTSCEGDVPGLVSMLLLNRLTDNPAAFLDLVNIEKENNILEAWHCGGIAHNLAAGGYQSSYCEHPTIKQGMGPALDFPIKTGPVTIVRLSEYEGEYRLFFIEGRAEKVAHNYRGNTTRIKPEGDVMEIFNTIAYEGVEHHFALVHGHAGRELSEYAALSDFTIITS